jgi:hypothetical protein
MLPACIVGAGILDQADPFHLIKGDVLPLIFPTAMHIVFEVQETDVSCPAVFSVDRRDHADPSQLIASVLWSFSK